MRTMHKQKGLHSKNSTDIDWPHILIKEKDVRSLSNDEVQEARALRAQGETLQRLAIKYGCSITTVWWWIVPTMEKLEIKMKYKPRAVTCYCGAYLQTHARCPNCTILLHGKECDCTTHKLYISQTI